MSISSCQFVFVFAFGKSVIITYLDLLDDVRINHNSRSVQGGVPEIIWSVHKHNKWQG